MKTATITILDRGKIYGVLSLIVAMYTSSVAILMNYIGQVM